MEHLYFWVLKLSEFCCFPLTISPRLDSVWTLPFFTYHFSWVYCSQSRMLGQQFILSTDWIEGRSSFNGWGADVVTNPTSAADKLTPHKGTLKYRRHLKDDPCYSNVTTFCFLPHNVRLAAFQEPIVGPIRRYDANVRDIEHGSWLVRIWEYLLEFLCRAWDFLSCACEVDKRSN